MMIYTYLDMNPPKKSHNLLDEVLSTILKFKMIERGDKVLISFSGGSDSLALLDILSKYQKKFQISLHAFHLNHQIRGQRAKNDEIFVKNLCLEKKIPLISLSYNVPDFARKKRLSLEEAGRKIRLKLLKKTAREIKATKIALGHNADDRIETFLMRLIRGTGLDGLASISPITGILIRPLIETNREEIERYLKKQGLNPCFDETNLDRRYLRNRLRLDLIPKIIIDYNPKFKQNIIKTIEIISSEVEKSALISQNLENEIATKEKDTIYLDGKRLKKISTALERRLIREAARFVKGNLINISYQQIEDIRKKIVRGKSGARINLPENLVVENEYGKILFYKMKKGEEIAPGLKSRVYALKIPGVTKLKELNQQIEASFLKPGEINLKVINNIALFDLEKIGLPLIIRPLKKGDRFQPLGLKGTKKISDFFIDHKIPRKNRDKAMVVTSDDNIIWLAGYRIDNRFKIIGKTRNILKLELKSN